MRPFIILTVLLGSMAAARAGKCVTRVLSLLEPCKQECSAGDQDACAFLGRFYEKGPGLPRDLAQAAALFRSSCDKGSARGCGFLGDALARGTGMASDAPRGLAMLEESAAKVPDLWATLGYLHLDGVGVRKNPGQATLFFARGCDRGSTSSCLELADVLAAGKIVPQNLTRALEIYTKACDGGAGGGCYALSYYADHGKGGVAQDGARAEALLAKACELDTPGGCTLLGARLVKSGDRERGLALMKKACDGWSYGCDELARASKPAPAVKKEVWCGESGTIACNGRCVHDRIDPRNCGGCGNRCPSGYLCDGGQCRVP